MVSPLNSLMKKILKRKIRPEAILCLNDDAALAAMQACLERGVRIPNDIAFTGFGNSSVSQYSWPPLTSVSFSTESMVSKAIDLLLRQIQGEKLSQEETLIELPCELVPRQSCGGHPSLC